MPSAERRLLDREQLDRLMRAVDDLSPRCREVFILRKLEEMPSPYSAVQPPSIV